MGFLCELQGSQVHYKLLSPGTPVAHCPKQARKAEVVTMNEVGHRMKNVATCREGLGLPASALCAGIQESPLPGITGIHSGLSAL